NQFHDRVARRNARLAVAASPAQDEIAEHWNVVVKRDRHSAVRTSRSWAYHGEAARQAINADVQETAEDESEQQECRDVEHLEWVQICFTSNILREKRL